MNALQGGATPPRKPGANVAVRLERWVRSRRIHTKR